MNRQSLIASSLLAFASLALPACTVDRDTSPYAGQPDPDRPNVNPRIITSTPDLMVALGFDEPIVVGILGIFAIVGGIFAIIMAFRLK